jgi:SAM-dependent methyltransferase
MSERGGVWSILEHPRVYEALAVLSGVRRFMKQFTETTIRAKDGDTVLDIGCGPGALLDFLPDVDYVGIDYSERNIAYAKAKHGRRGHFICDDVANLSRHQLPAFDIAIAYGLLHHIDDDAVLHALRAMADALKPGGRLVAIDPCYDPAETFVQRFVNSRDRGKRVRQMAHHLALCRSVFPDLQTSVASGYLPFPQFACVIQARR